MSEAAVNGAEAGATGSDDRVEPWLFTARIKLRGAMVAGALLLAGVLLQRVWKFEAGLWLEWASLAIGLVYGGRAAMGAIADREFNIDVLMVVGAVMAGAMGAPAEGALLLFLFVLSGALEELAHARTTRAIEALHALMPQAALRWSEDEQEWVEVAPDSLSPGDIARVLPGETVPVDGVMVAWDGSAASAALDQAALTGESMPRVVRPGEEVYAGTINAGDALVMRVTRAAAQSSLQRVLNLVLEAQQRRQPVQRVIDRLSQPYAIGVMVVSALVFLVWWLGFRDGVVASARTAMTLLIVASPCAVIISTPTAMLAAISRGARAGVLFKGGGAIERLGRVRALVLDKTGTLTVGRPRLVEVTPIGCGEVEAMLAVASGLEQDSTHPIADAIRQGAQERGLTPAPVRRVSFTPGRGVLGAFGGGEARLGTLEHAGELLTADLRDEAARALEASRGQGRIAVLLAYDGCACVLALSDEVRPGAEELVGQLHAVGIRPAVMLTGDNEDTAERVAAVVKPDSWRAGMLPEDKVAEIERMKREHGRVGMVGDGVNDAPSLAAADVAMAVGSIGSDAALESSDVVLLSDHLAVVPWAVRLARRTRRTVAINLVFALSVIGVMGLATLVGSRIDHPVPLWLGVLGHEGGTLLVVANSLSLLLVRSPRTATGERAIAPGEAAREVDVESLEGGEGAVGSERARERESERGVEEAVAGA